MDRELLLNLIENMSVTGLAAYIFSQISAFKRMMNGSTYKYDKVVMGAFFICLSILGNFININFNGTHITTRPIGIITAGIFGGPGLGTVVGFVSGIHRFFMGGYNAFPALIASICQGLVAGCFNYFSKDKEIDELTSIIAGLMAGAVHLVLIIALTESFEITLSTFKAVSIPMAIVNAVGVAIFVNIIRNVRRESNRAAALQAQKVLSIANMSMPHIRKGFNSLSVQKVAEIIINESDVDAVCIADDKEILAYVGTAGEYSHTGQTITEGYLKDVLESGKIKTVNKDKETEYEFLNSEINSAIVVPLIFQDGKVRGLIAFYYTNQKRINCYDIEFAAGIGQLFATGYELAWLEEQSRMIAISEFKALQAQIQPHFIFNSLNTIASFCRINPPKARELILNLSNFLRKTINKGEMYLTIEEELNFINSYLSIQKARFGERLKIEFNIPHNLLKNKIPTLTIQPLVENSIKHGISKKPGGGKVEICIKEDSKLLDIRVIDSGIGIPEEKLNDVLSDSEGIGLKNINDRLINLYGKDFGLSIQSCQGIGTTVYFKIPIQ